MKVEAPWTAEQAGALNAWQRSDFVHPFTCGNERMDNDHVRYAAAHGGDNGQLMATPNGWFCPVCSYRQTWAHDFMFDAPPVMHGAFMEPPP